MRKITVGHIEIGKPEKRAIMKVLDSGRISEGAKTREFEEKWARYIGTKYCVATSSGTAALITLFSSLSLLKGLKKRPKVITSPLTYISDANALVLTGFEPVFVDIDPMNFCITPENIEKHLESVRDTSEYSAILAVDLMGYPAQYDRIKRIAGKYGLFVIEDAAEAHGTLYHGKKCGANADAGIFSFYIAHNLSAGEMGAITTDSYELCQMCRKMKTNGRFCKCRVCLRHLGKCPFLNAKDGEEDSDPRFLHDVIGYNFKVMEFQTALACVQVSRVDSIVRKRQENVKYLNDGLKEFSNLLQLPLHSREVSYLAYPVVIKDNGIISRRELRCRLEKNMVETRPIFGCIPTQQPAYAHLRKTYLGKLPNAEYIGANGFYIGCHQYLKRQDLDHIIKSFKGILRGKNG